MDVTGVVVLYVSMTCLISVLDGADDVTSASDFWTSDRIEAYLGSVEDSDMLILDLFSESHPQWQRTNSYYGKPWIWCQLHNYGGNMGLYGQVENVTYNPVQALGNSSSTMVGMGLTMEGQEGNEVIYDILLDQAWSEAPLNSRDYFEKWVTSRYHSDSLPSAAYDAWDTLRTTVYNNTRIDQADSVMMSIFERLPNTTGLLGVTGSHGTITTYDRGDLVSAWQALYSAAGEHPTLWSSQAFTYDLVDISRQVMANAFTPLYTTFVHAANSSLDSYSEATATETGHQMIDLLTDLDALLSASGIPHFNLPPWIAAARAWANPSRFIDTSNMDASEVKDVAKYYEYNARNQITLWGPTGQINSYASKHWGGLISTYDIPRWQLFIDYTMNSSTASDGDNPELFDATMAFEQAWQHETWGESLEESYTAPPAGELHRVFARVVRKWPDIFGQV